MTDLLGVCESWDADALVVRREDGQAVRVPLAEVVAGKPVPPRPDRLARLAAAEVERRAAATLRPGRQEALGEWLLRASDGPARRGNSALLAGDPGLPFSEAVDRVERWYRAGGRVPLAQVVTGSVEHERLERLGWQPVHAAGRTLVLLGSVSQLRRPRSTGREDRPEDRFEDRPEDRSQGASLSVRTMPTAERDWLELIGATEQETARHLREAGPGGAEEAAFLLLSRADRPVAGGRLARSGDWAVLTDLYVVPDARRGGLARRVVTDLLDLAAEQGAGVLVVQVRADNAAARALYGSAGLRAHHDYCYLSPDGADGPDRPGGPDDGTGPGTT